MAKQSKEKDEKSEFLALLKRTDKENPKAEDLELLRAELKENNLMVLANDPTRATMDAVIRSFSANGLKTELLRRNVELRREEMKYYNEDLMVRMLIDQVILSEMRLCNFEVVHGNRTNEPHTPRMGRYYDDRLSMAERRFLRACESLAKTKRLLSEAEHFDARAKHKRGQSTLASEKLLNNLTR